MHAHICAPLGFRHGGVASDWHRRKLTIEFIIITAEDQKRQAASRGWRWDKNNCAPAPHFNFQRILGEQLAGSGH